MKRWFLARLGDYDPNDPGCIVPKVAAYPCNWRAWSRTGMAWGIGQLAAANVDAMALDADIHLVPASTMDTTLSTWPATARNLLNTRLTAAGFDTAAIRNSWTVRQVLQHLKLQLQADNDVDSGDVQEP